MADIFLSYSRKDSQMKDRLADDLRQAGLSVWTDDGLVPGTPSWHQSIEDEIEAAGCLVVILSPDAKRSEWVRRELDYAKLQNKRIFPTVVRGSRTEAVPIMIIDAQLVDLRTEYDRQFKLLVDELIRHVGRRVEEELQQTVLPAVGEGVDIPYVITGGPPLFSVWCWVPAGPFTMGSDRRDDEKPADELTLDGFWLARYPLTNSHYRRFVDAGGYQDARWWTVSGWNWRQNGQIDRPLYWDEDKWNRESLPVVGVSWFEANAFARWLAKSTGEPIGLPTEAEWEKAARGPGGRTYPWGEEPPTAELANFDKVIGGTTPVGRYSPAGDSMYGIVDMAGNVWEWTASTYQPYLVEHGDGPKEAGQPEASLVIRGGAWNLDGGFLRATYRDSDYPSSRLSSIGFRLVRRPTA